MVRVALVADDLRYLRAHVARCTQRAASLADREALAVPADVRDLADRVDVLASADLALALADRGREEHRDFCLRVDREMLRAVRLEDLHPVVEQADSATRRPRKAR